MNFSEVKGFSIEANGFLVLKILPDIFGIYLTPVTHDRCFSNF